MAKKFEEPYLLRILFSFIIATTVFVLIFSVAHSFSYMNYQSVSSQTNLISLYLEELDYSLDHFECSDTLLFESSERLDFAGSKLNLLEKRFGKNDERVLEQKNLYSGLEFSHFQIVKKLNSRCDSDFLTFLFFYSNEDKLQKESERTGFILGTFKQKHPESVMVYSFDFNLDSEIVGRLKDNYNITAVPMIIVNEKDSIVINNIDDLEAYLQ